MARDLFDAVYGCLVGGAIGDALGAPVEGWHVSEIRARYGKVVEMLPQQQAAERSTGAEAGRLTDDSTLRQLICQAIIAKPGRITPDDYAAVWLSSMESSRFFITERIVLEKLRLGMNPWESGRGLPAANAALMSIAPVGLINCGRPADAYLDAFALASMHQDGLERDAAATTAAGIAAAVQPESTWSSVLAAMRRYSTYQVRRLIERGASLADENPEVDRFVDACYATILDDSFPLPSGQEWELGRSPSPTSRETLPAVIGLLCLTANDPNQALVEGASFGRDADTIASILGTFVGTIQGASALDHLWIEQVERVNGDIFPETGPLNGFADTAHALAGTIKTELTATRERVDELMRTTGRWRP